MREFIRNLLINYAEEGYKDFSSSLVPGAKPLLGVRLPQLRKIAKELIKKDSKVFDWQKEVLLYDKEYEDIYFEENMLRGMIIGYGTASKTTSCEEGLMFLKAFIPHVDNWATCDSFCNSFIFANHYKDEVLEFLQPYLYSTYEYEVRTALILLLSQYLRYGENNQKRDRNRKISMADLNESHPNMECSIWTLKQFPYIIKIFSALNREFTQGYYAQMAAAWTLAEAFVYFPYETNQYLIKDCNMDKYTYNKALQKIRESRNPDLEVKEYIKSLKK